VRGDQGGVQIDSQPVRRSGQLPHTGTRAGVRRAERFEQPRRGRDPVDHPERRGGRGGRPEQRDLITNRAQVGKAVTAFSEHHREIADHRATVMATGPQPGLSDRVRQRPRQPRPIRDLGRQRCRHARPTRLRPP
jgi:hypothetical protein